ncbi:MULTISPECIES: winged helix DNA-binding protein [Paenibacillus]|uniref:winged helix DNA-binding protein n=1 Tax=Paenibacillus TaxID=44249 RepID=UPI000E230236|nr:MULTISPECIES: winged helix DNA-binding protein [Paenibacillus]MCM2996614.1 winged helix DNA-binding protein [Paenibacillus cellulositrophicus]RED37045.1 DNA-binding MarR family transcriptional regulator [Paenibacillus sp. VMFN-D1]
MNRSKQDHPSPGEWPQKEIVIQEMMSSIAQIQRRFQAEGIDEERQWMISHTDNPEVKAVLQESTIVMLHVIDAVGQLEPVNGITISKQFDIPRGSVSKVTRRLIVLGVIESESLPDNKKEVFFRLTPLGREIYDVHEALHGQIERNAKRFMQRYTLEELQLLAAGMRDTLGTSFVEPMDGEEEEVGGNRSGAPETAVISEILGQLQRLEERELRKVRDMIQLMFFD